MPNSAPLRIVSLISSATEILCRLGLAKNLVGISHECDYPEEIKNLPVVSEPKLDPSKSGREIDQEVRRLVSDGLSVYRIRTEWLEKLEPDLIVTQDQCEVCAVSLKDVETAVSSLTLRTTAVCSLKPNSLQDIVSDIRHVGAVTGSSDAAEDLVAEFQERLDRLRKSTTNLPFRPTVLCLEWLEPAIVAGGWIPEIVRAAGGEPLIVKGPEAFKKVDWDEIASNDPDTLILMPCGYPIRKTVEELLDISAISKLNELRAVKSRRAFICDGNAYFNRPGPRIADSAEILAGLLHPTKFPEFLTHYRGGYLPWRGSPRKA